MIEDDGAAAGARLGSALTFEIVTVKRMTARSRTLLVLQLDDGCVEAPD